MCLSVAVVRTCQSKPIFALCPSHLLAKSSGPPSSWIWNWRSSRFSERPFHWWTSHNFHVADSGCRMRTSPMYWVTSRATASHRFSAEDSFVRLCFSSDASGSSSINLAHRSRKNGSACRNVLGHRGPENPVASMACLKGIHSLNARSTFCGKHILDEARSVTSKPENR